MLNNHLLFKFFPLRHKHVDSFAQWFWYSPNFLCYLFLPLTWIYCLVVFIRLALYRIGLKTSHNFKRPIIIVGNITVGGTGKTPLVIWLAKFLHEKGFNPGIVSRGYRSKNKNETHLVDKNDDVLMIGDEASLLANNCECPVIIGKNRAAAVKRLLAETDCDIVISDDGLQHYALHRDIEIAVIDGERCLGNGFCLPAGPLRESKNRLQSVDFIITNNVESKKNLGNTNECSISLKPMCFYNLEEPDLIKTKEDFLSLEVHAVAAIGNPKRFFVALRSLGMQIIEHPFPDHHWFTPEDLNFSDEKIIIMTEKDAVKCKKFAKKNFWVLRVAAEIPGKFGENLIGKIAAL